MKSKTKVDPNKNFPADYDTSKAVSKNFLSHDRLDFIYKIFGEPNSKERDEIADELRQQIMHGEMDPGVEKYLLERWLGKAPSTLEHTGAVQVNKVVREIVDVAEPTQPTAQAVTPPKHDIH